MRFKFLSKSVIILLISVFFFNCSSKSEDVPADLEVNDFVWKGLNAYYLWQSSKPDLADTRFSSQIELNNYLSGFPTPEILFESLLNRPTDRFSWIVDDYIALENSFEGITLNNGMEFNLYLENGSATNIFGVVRYVIPNSDAEAKGVIRGMVFNSVNGNQLTDTNYRSLLFGVSTDYTIDLADFNGGNPILNGSSISLSKSQLQENPIPIVKTFDEGANKIGYILYNQFASSFDGELNAAFGTLKAAGITDLIIDLLYIGGGSVRTATYLGSMITTESNESVFSKLYGMKK